MAEEKEGCFTHRCVLKNSSLQQTQVNSLGFQTQKRKDSNRKDMALEQNYSKKVFGCVEELSMRITKRR